MHSCYAASSTPSNAPCQKCSAYSLLRRLNAMSIVEGLRQLLGDPFLLLQEIRFKRHLKSRSLLFLPSTCDELVSENGSCCSDNLKDCQNHVDLHKVSLAESAQKFSLCNQVDAYKCKVFLGNISFKVRERELWDFCEHFGKVLRVSIIKDRKTKRSRGFGFVVFSSPFEAERAVHAKSHELKLSGRVMTVTWAKKRKGANERPGELGTQKLKEATELFVQLLASSSSKGVDSCSSSLAKDCLAFAPAELLNRDMLLKIFSLLDVRSRVAVELVCKKWQNAAIESWGSVENLHFQNMFRAFQGSGGLTDRILLSLLKKGCQNLKRLDLSGSPYLLTDRSLLKIGDICKGLLILNMSNVPIRNSTLKVLGAKCAQLKELYMNHCLNAGEKGLWWMVKDLKELEVLHVSDNLKLQGKWLYMLHEKIRSLNISNCRRISDVGLVNIARKCQNLTDLDISNCSAISNAGLQTVFQACRRLENLSVGGSAIAVSPEGLLHISSLSQLRSLDLSQNVAVTDAVLDILSRACLTISSLRLEACHGEISCAGIRSLAHLPNLEHLTISYIKAVCDTCLCDVARGGKLRTLIARSCSQLGNQAMEDMLLYCEQLELLDVSGCFRVTDDFAHSKHIVKRNWNNQHRLELVLGGTQVTGEGVEVLEKKLAPCSACMQSFSLGLLRNDFDPTLIAPFYPSSDEEDDLEVEDPPIVLGRQALEIAPVEDESPDDIDEEKPWKLIQMPAGVPDNVTHPCETETSSVIGARSTVSSSMAEVADQSPAFAKPPIDLKCEENWDDEIQDGLVWCLPDDAITPHTDPSRDDFSDFLEADDPLYDDMQYLS